MGLAPEASLGRKEHSAPFKPANCFGRKEGEMKETTATQRRGGGIAVKIVPAQVLLNRMQELNEAIARRAYDLFERRGRQRGRDLEDWLQAESELLQPCRHDLRESDEAIVLRAEVPGSFTPEQFQISVEPRRLMISAEREVTVIRGDGKGSHEALARQRLLRVHDLPEEVDPSKSTATLDGETLEVRMPKLRAASAYSGKAKGASSGR